MKKGISISLLALTLAACGGGSSSGGGDPVKAADSTKGINKDFAEGIRGPEQEPTLTTAAVTAEDSIDLNSNVSGTTPSFADNPRKTTTLTFSVPENQRIALVLSSSAADLDISVANNKTPNSEIQGSYGSKTSNEAVVFDAIAGEIYRVQVENDSDNENTKEEKFQLKLVTANRSSLGLSANEYIVEAQHIDSQECIKGDKTSKYNETTTKLRIFNWKEAYSSRLSKTDKHNFSLIDGDNFSVVFANKDNEDAENETYEYSYNFKYATDFQSGKITGNATNKTKEYKNNVLTETCVSTVAITGKVIL